MCVCAHSNIINVNKLGNNHLLHQDNGTQLAKYAVRMSRKDLKSLVGLITGRNTLNRHLSLLTIINRESYVPSLWRRI